MNIRIVYVASLCVGICLGIGSAFVFTENFFILPQTYTLRGIVTSTPIEPLAVSIHHPLALATTTSRRVHINNKTTFLRSTYLYDEYGTITRMITNPMTRPLVILPGTALMVAETSATSPALTVVMFERIKE